LADARSSFTDSAGDGMADEEEGQPLDSAAFAALKA
jgi:hypothetical protein